MASVGGGGGWRRWSEVGALGSGLIRRFLSLLFAGSSGLRYGYVHVPTAFFAIMFVVVCVAVPGVLGASGWCLCGWCLPLCGGRVY